jgi:L-amino acid N-acyltransferase YncA
VALRIRLAGEADGEAVAAIYRPIVETTIISFESVPPDGREMARRIVATLPRYPWLVGTIDAKVAGYAYAFQHHPRDGYRWSVNISVYVDAGFHRRGLGRGLYRSLFAILAAQGFVNAYAGIALPNPASIGLHESLGFAKVGVYTKPGYKFGTWHDVGWWQLSLQPHPASPGDPVDLDVLRRREDWTTLLARGEGAA